MGHDHLKKCKISCLVGLLNEKQGPSFAHFLYFSKLPCHLPKLPTEFLMTLLMFVLTCNLFIFDSSKVGDTLPCRQRCTEHRGAVRNHWDTGVGEHFNLPGHELAHFNFLPFEKEKLRSLCDRGKRKLLD